MLLVALLVGTGWLLTSRLYRLTWWERLVVGPALTTILGLFGVNLGLRLGGELSTTLLMTAVSLVGASLFVARSPTASRDNDLSRTELVMVGLCLGVLYLLTNQGQLSTPDDDYWLHTPVQRMMAEGVFPPRNPVFPELPLHGHYGRDLLIVATHKATSLDLFGAQLAVTTLSHALAAALAFVLMRRFCTSLAPAWVAWLFAYLGVGTAYKTGLLETFQNNNGPVHLHLFLLVYLVLDTLEQPTWPKSLILGVAVGTYSFVYETHLGLFGLASLVTVGAHWAWGRLSAGQIRHLIVSGLLAALLACSHGGAFTDLASRLAGGSPAYSETALMNQAQRASLSFPKSQFLRIRIGEHEYQPVSTNYQFWPGTVLFELLDHPVERDHPLYVPIWSWTVVRMHWLALWLAPWTLYYCVTRRQTVALFFWSFGATAYLVPAVVNFGPVHEWEWYRWEFAAGLGLAIAAGAMLGRIFSESKWVTRIVLLLIVALNLNAGVRVAYGGLGRMQARDLTALTTMRVDHSSWLTRHREPLRILEGDLEAIARLQELARPGERVLVNFRPEDPWAILFESTLTGLTGLVPVGHALPRDDDQVGLPPFRRQPAVDAFLENPTREGLQALNIDWLYIKLVGRELSLGPAYLGLDGVEQVFRTDRRLWTILVFRVE